MCVLSICSEEHLNTGKMSCDKVLKAMELGNETLLQYYHEQVISVVDRAKKLSDAELIVKLASSSVGERIFRDLRSEIYIPSEEKTSTDWENGRLLIALNSFASRCPYSTIVVSKMEDQFKMISRHPRHPVREVYCKN